MEEKAHTISNAAFDAVIMMDADGVVAHWNPSAERMFGYSSDEIVGHNLFQLLTTARVQKIAPNVLARYLKFRRKRAIGRVFEMDMIRKSGEQFPVEATLSPLEVDVRWYFVAIARDITERRKVVDELQQSHDELRAIYDGMVDGLLLAECRTKRFVAANHAICNMLGYSKEELLTLSVMDIHPPDDVARVIEAFNLQVQGRLKLAENLPCLRKNGSVFYADISCNRVVYHGELCSIGFFRDITERKTAEESLRREQQTLRRLLRAHDQDRKLIAYEIHDGLAQQLVAAILQCQALQQGPGASSDAKHASATILPLLKECLAETRRLISGVRPPTLDHSGVVSAIQNLIADIEPSKGPAIELKIDFTSARLDPILENVIYRVTQEALTNAIRHSGSERVRIGLAQTGEQVRLEVRDWGVGFDVETVGEKRFGLVGIRERVRLLGGQISVNSNIGKGTCIDVTLPIDIEKADQ